MLLGPGLGFGLVTSERSIELISEIGLILLLFIIGLEIDVRELRRLGRSMLVLGVGQFTISALLGLAFFAWLGYRWGGGNFELLYLAVVISLSSTLIVVKLLRDKFELKVLSGRLTLGVLVVQDIWAILFMAVQPNLADPSPPKIAQSIAGGAVLVALAFVASRYVLAGLLEAAANRPELVLLSAIAWCFVTAGVAERLGLSREMGALIAGVSISAFPYGADVITKITGVRDFFVTLFFVSLGMTVPLPDLGRPRPRAAHRGLRLREPPDRRGAARVPPRRWALRRPRDRPQSRPDQRVLPRDPDPRRRVRPRLRVAGRGRPHRHDHHLARLDLRDRRQRPAGPAPAPPLRAERARPAPPPRRRRRTAGGAATSCSSATSASPRPCSTSSRTGPPAQGADHPRRLSTPRGAAPSSPAASTGQYGDLANPDTLEHLGIEHARIVVTTISDTFLKGISTRRLVSNLRRLAPAPSS